MVSYATVCGGSGNSATEYVSFVGGGLQNQATGMRSVVSGGFNNLASADGSTVGGGEENASGGMYSTIPGGFGNVASANYSFAAGTQARAIHDYSFIWNDGFLGPWSTGNEHQFVIHATGGVGIGTNSPSSQLDVAGTVTMTGLHLPTGAGAGYVLTSNGTGVGTWQPATGSGGWVDDGAVVRLQTGTDKVGIGTTTPNEQLEITGNLRLPQSTASAGVIKSGGSRFIHNFGTDNTFIGRDAGNLTMTGAGGNTASGFRALTSNTDGYDNTASGVEALRVNTSGHHNTASGYQALYSNGSGHHNTASGITALGNNSTGNNNTADGVNALLGNTSGAGNTASGYYALNSNATGNYNTAIGYWADVSTGALTNATAIGANATVDASNKIRLGNGAVTVIEGEVAYTFTSDENRKENFRPVDGDEVLRKIRKLGVTSWNYKGQDAQQFRHYGPVAQEFFAAFGHDGVGTSGTPTTINSGDEAGILMIAIQALEKRTEEIVAIKAENQELQAQIAELREMIRALASKQK